MKITHIIGSFPNPSEVFIVDLISELGFSQEGQEIIAVKGLKEGFKHTNQTFKVCGFELKKPAFLLFVYYALRYLKPLHLILREEKTFLKAVKKIYQIISLLHFYDKTSKVVMIHFLTLVPSFISFCKISNIPMPKIISTVRGYEFNTMTGLTNDELELINNENVILLPVSSRLETLCNKFIPSAKVTKIYSYLDAERYSFRPKCQLNKIIKILIIGRFVEKKGIFEIVSWLSLWGDFMPHTSFYLDIIGDGEDKIRLKQIIDIFPLRDQVTLHGFLPNKKVLGYLSQADIVISNNKPSKFFDIEGIPNVIKEAMLSGAFVIASNDQGNMEITDDGKFGFIYQESNRQDFYEQIRKYVLLSRAERLRILNAARFRVRHLFGKSATLGQIEKIINDL